MIQPNPLLGTVLHAVGAISATLCYTPQKATKAWSWQTYWLAQASVCWIALPVIVAWITIPEIATVLAEAPRSAMVNSFALGALYGVGGTAFGLAIRHIGFSLTYAIAIGISCVLGTLVPPMLSGELNSLVHKPGAGWILSGIAIGTIGILVSGLAGRMKELDLQKGGGATSTFNLRLGLPLVLLAGVLSAVYGMALAAGQPIADVAAHHGAGAFQGNIIYIFSNSGAFVTTALYSLWLHARHKTFGEYIELPEGPEKASLPINLTMALLTGCLWYGQFFFYGLGHVRMGEYQFTSWAIHMIMLVLFSAVLGVLLREWKGCKLPTKFVLAVSFVVLAASVVALTVGNKIGATPSGH